MAPAASRSWWKSCSTASSGIVRTKLNMIALRFHGPLKGGAPLPFISRKHPSRDVIFSGQNLPKMISLHDLLEPLKQALWASRDVIISSQICVSKLQRVFTLGDGCWLPNLHFLQQRRCFQHSSWHSPCAQFLSSASFQTQPLMTLPQSKEGKAPPNLPILVAPYCTIPRDDLSDTTLPCAL